MIYGALEVREQLLNGVRPSKLASRTQTPKLAFRGIKLNTPWDSYRPSSAIDQHTATMKDLKFWEAFLDMMVENRFNTFTLWTMHPFTYMIRPKNFPEASKWTRRGVRASGSVSTARSSAWPRSAASTPTSCSGASS